VNHLIHYGKDPSLYTTHSWLMTAIAESISEVRGSLGVGAEVLKDPTIVFVQIPNGNDGLHVCVGVMHYHAYMASGAQNLI
jgi:hypothetical protein